MKSIKKLVKGVVMAVGAVVILFAGCVAITINSDKAETKTETKQEQSDKAEEKKENKQVEVVKIKAKDLVKEFEENSIDAVAKYEGKQVEVTGKIYNINEVVGSYYVVINGGGDLEFQGVQCYVEKEDIKGLKKGQEVTFRGVLEEETFFANVELKDCALVK